MQSNRGTFLVRKTNFPVIYWPQHMSGLPEHCPAVSWFGRRWSSNASKNQWRIWANSVFSIFPRRLHFLTDLREGSWILINLSWSAFYGGEISLDQSKRERFGILKSVLEFCIRSSCANTRGGFYCFFLQMLGYDSLFQIYSQHFPHAHCQHCSFSHDLQRPGLENLDSEPRGITCLWQMCVCQSWMRFGRFANGGRHSANKTSSSVISGPPLIPACPAAASLASPVAKQD